MKNLLIILVTLFMINNVFAGEKEPGYAPIPPDILNDLKANLDRIILQLIRKTRSQEIGLSI